MIDDVTEIWDDVASFVEKHVKFSLRFSRAEPIQKEFIDEFFGEDFIGSERNFRNRVSEIVYDLYNNPKSVYTSLKVVYKKFKKNVVDELSEIIDDAWLRVLENAKEDMFAALEDEGRYDDPYEIGEDEVFEHYGNEEMVSWMRQEIAHNVQGNKVFDMYVDGIDWDDLERKARGYGLDSELHKQTDEDLEEQLQDIYNNILDVVNKINSEINMQSNKKHVMDLVFTSGYLKWDEQ